MPKKTVKIGLLLLTSFLLISRLSAGEILIGGSEGWEQIDSFSGTALRSSEKQKHLSTPAGEIELDGMDRRVLSMAEASYSFDHRNDDLLLHFDHPGDILGNYEVLEETLLFHERERMFGEASALFRGRESELRLRPKRDSLFWPGSLWDDFTLEFWLRPHYLEHGETVLSWQGSRMIDSRIESQELRLFFEDRKLIWSFRNIFFPGEQSTDTIQISGRNSLVPEQWHHHRLSFNAEDGMLLYQIDGRDEAILYINSRGKEGGDVYLPYIGAPKTEELRLGGSFTGYIDELRLRRSFDPRSMLKPYPLKSAFAETQAIDLGEKHSRLISISTDSSTEGTEEIHYYYRQGEEKSAYTELPGEWKPFSPEQGFPRDARGRYLQLRFELFPDGSGMSSPTLSHVKILYENDQAPPPPNFLRAIAINGGIRLSWSPVSAQDLSGYRVFYGTAPDDYRGKGAESGSSPLDAGNRESIDLQGLEPGRLYFFRIAAYDNDDPDHIGTMSQEVYARPLTDEHTTREKM